MNYVLKKDVIMYDGRVFKAGTVFTPNDEGGRYDYQVNNRETRYFSKSAVENNTDFFEPEVWKPSIDTEYYFVNTFGDVSKNNNKRFDIDDMRYSVGNCFKTREAAERAAAQIREILKNAERE